jgi:phytoene dehydrogenase-like protein
VEKYDVAIIGGGLGSLTTATYLSKRLRNVAVFEEGNKHKLEKYSRRFRDDQRFKYEFNFPPSDLGGVHNGDLFNEYLKRCDMDKRFDYYDNLYTMIVGKDKQITKRPNSMKHFKIYLVRHYPKQRNQIHALFEDISRHYKDYRNHKLARLNNQQYTISSLLIEWGDLSLLDVLTKYFTDEKLMNEFLLVYNAIGFTLDQINAHHYFIKWFDTFIDGSHFITSSYEDIIGEFTKEISKSREKMFTNRKIEKCVIRNNKIQKIIDSDGNEIEAKHYVINMRIDDFADYYLDGDEKIKNHFYRMYPGAKEQTYTNRVYLGFSKPANLFGMNNNQYLFSKNDEDEVQFLSIINYKDFDSKSCADGRSAIMIEYIDNGVGKDKQLDLVVEQFYKYFPNAEQFETLRRIDRKSPYLASLSTQEYWENKTINDLFSIDDYSDLNPFDNAYFIGAWTKPEAGISGIIQIGVEYGDIIDDLIYHGDDDDYFITHDELMNIITNQFIPGSLGKKEQNIQFFIGKDSYFVRVKGKHQRLYKGTSDISDIIIIATNECLYDLSVGNTTLEQAIKNGTFEYVGNKEYLNEIMEAFDMGIKITKPNRYDFVQGTWGIKIMLLQLSILLLSNLLANYHLYIYLAPITLALFGATVYLKYRLIAKITVFEYFVMGLYFVLSIVSIFVPALNSLKDSTYTLLIFTLYFLGTWLFNSPIAFGYVRHDYRTDYTRTKLFTKMTGGLTFIWGVTFLLVLIATVALERSFASLSYYIVPLSLYLSFYYPSNYIRGYHQ